MKKRFLMVAMTICLVISMAACGESVETKDDVVASQESCTENSKEAEVADKETETPKEEDPIPESKEQSIASGEEKRDEELQIVPMASSESLLAYYDLPESKGFVFESKGDGTCTLVEIGTCEDEVVVIPEKSPDGDTVTTIAKYAFYNAEDISEIVILGKVLKVDDKAFQGCEFEKLVIGDCELEIGENAFEYCGDVEEITIFNSKLEISTYAFYDSGNNARVEIIDCEGTIKDKAFQTASISALIVSDSTLSVGENAFEYIDDMELLQIVGSNVEIGTYAFYDAGDDMQILCIDNVLDIDDKAFQTCDVVSLKIQGKDILLGESVFEYCKDLADVVLDGEDTIEIDTYSFYGCESLTNVSLGAGAANPERQIVLDDKSFQSCAVVNVSIGTGKVEIGKDAFSNCKELKCVEIKGELQSVGKYAFYGCSDELVIAYNGAVFNKETIENMD